MFEIIENKNKFGIENFLPYLCNSCFAQIENCLQIQEKINSENQILRE